MEKFCLECNEPIRGRADKKFCSDLCRNAYNNKLNSDSSNLMRNVNNILRKNRRILEGLIPDEMAKISKSKLADLGFNFNYFTNLYTNKKGDTYYFIYEFGYLPIEHDYMLLVKRKSKEEHYT